MNNFISGRLRLKFKDYSNDKYNELVLPKFPAVDEFCVANHMAACEMFDTDEPKVYFDYKVVRPTIKECRAVRTLLKAKLKELYGVAIEEVFCAEGSCY